jgi:hypothetical protein
LRGGNSDTSSSASASDSSSEGDSIAATAGEVRQALRVPTGLPELVVKPGGKVVLPVVAAGGGSTVQQGMHVGRPCAFQGVALPTASSATQPQHSSSRQSRPLLYFRLSEQQQACGPLRLDRGSFSGCQPGASSCPGVLCDMKAERHGGFTLTLHSGVQVGQAVAATWGSCWDFR